MNSVYVAGRYEHNTLKWEDRLIVKRIFSKDRVVIFWQSILEDELLPTDPNCWILNETGW